jgi:phosphohistidine phosphatase
MTTPARRLWVLRHAKTRPNPPPGRADYDRRLTGRGRRDAAALGNRLGPDGDRLGLPADAVFTRVLCSSARRTLQTAQRVTSPMRPTPDVLVTRRLYRAEAPAMLGELAAVDDAVTSVLLVGHNPGVHELCWELVGEETGRARLGTFPPGAVAVFDLGSQSWADPLLGRCRLEAFSTPPFEA